MKRHQIRKLIPGNISDAQLRAAIAALNLPVDDDLSYGEQETKWIIDSFKKAAPATGEPTPPQSTDASAALTLTRQTIAASTNTLQSQALSFANRIQEGDKRLAEQVADFLMERPNRFKNLLASALAERAALLEEPEFIDVDSVAAPALTFPSAEWDSSVAALGMAR